MGVVHLFLDLDGVAADFDAHYENLFGYRPSKALDNTDWSLVRAEGNFYETMPPMEDLDVLWRALEPYNPTILTGIPASVKEAAANKIAWVRKYLGNTPVLCCGSKFKHAYIKTGATDSGRPVFSLLIDDWTKYRDLWVNKGGLWITHFSAEETVHQFDQLMKVVER